jgi:hypothetical protein
MAGLFRNQRPKVIMQQLGLALYAFVIGTTQSNQKTLEQFDTQNELEASREFREVAILRCYAICSGLRAHLEEQQVRDIEKCLIIHLSAHFIGYAKWFYADYYVRRDAYNAALKDPHPNGIPYTVGKCFSAFLAGDPPSETFPQGKTFDAVTTMTGLAEYTGTTVAGGQMLAAYDYSAVSAFRTTESRGLSDRL